VSTEASTLNDSFQKATGHWRLDGFLNPDAADSAINPEKIASPRAQQHHRCDAFTTD